MTLIKWREEFCTGIAGVDFEHEHLIAQINEIYAMIDGGANKEDILNALGDIYGSISAHFALEEKMMETYKYDEYDAHKANHELLLDDIQDISDDFEDSVELDKEKFKQKLNDWFQIHFKTFDARLHKLDQLMHHDDVSDSLIKSMALKAKQAFLRKYDE